MSKLQSSKRARQDACRPKLQGKLRLDFEDEGDVRGVGGAGPPSAGADWGRRSPTQRNTPPRRTARVHPPSYRKVIAEWGLDWRERWGRRANSLEDAGLGWRDAETQAFVEVLNQIQARTDARERCSAGFLAPEPP